MTGSTKSNLEKLELVLAWYRSNLTVAEFCAKHGISETTFYRWRKIALIRLVTLIFDDEHVLQGKKATHNGKEKKSNL